MAGSLRLRAGFEVSHRSETREGIGTQYGSWRDIRRRARSSVIRRIRGRLPSGVVQDVRHWSKPLEWTTPHGGSTGGTSCGRDPGRRPGGAPLRIPVERACPYRDVTAPTGRARGLAQSFLRAAEGVSSTNGRGQPPKRVWGELGSVLSGGGAWGLGGRDGWGETGEASCLALFFACFPIQRTGLGYVRPNPHDRMSHGTGSSTATYRPSAGWITGTTFARFRCETSCAITRVAVWCCSRVSRSAINALPMLVKS